MVDESEGEDGQESLNLELPDLELEDIEWAPQRKVGEALAGFELTNNRQRQDGPKNGLFATIYEAKHSAAILAGQELVWVQQPNKSIIPMWDEDEITHTRHPALIAETPATDDRSKWMPAWRIHAIHEPIFERVECFVLPFPLAKYYAAAPEKIGPMAIRWGVYRRFQTDDEDEPIHSEAGQNRDDAIAAATRLSLGFKTQRQITQKRLLMWYSIIGVSAFSILMFLTFWIAS